MNRISTSSQFNEAYTYDSRGNRSTLQSENLNLPSDATYEYDVWNQLKKVTTGDNKVVTYKYNGDGLMTERTENGVTTRYYYDGPNIIAEATVTNGTPSLLARYVRGAGGTLIAREDASGNKAYYLHNGHGDVTELRDSKGDILNSYTYDIWGNPITAQEKVSNPFRYSGEFWDTTTKLQYLRARWYDPSQGRFLNEDTYEGSITNPLTMNLYTYVHNNPLIYSDPTGHWCTSTDGKYAHAGACNDGEEGKERYEGPRYTPDSQHYGEKEMYAGRYYGEPLYFDNSVYEPSASKLAFDEKWNEFIDWYNNLDDFHQMLASITLLDHGIGTKYNYRELYKKNNPDMPNNYQVHHTLPQKYNNVMVEAGISIHDLKYLRGVDPKIHYQITEEWRQWDKSIGGNPTAQQVIDFSQQIEEKYSQYWYKK